MVDVDHLLVSEEQYMLAEQQQLGRACAEAFENQQVGAPLNQHALFPKAKLRCWHQSLRQTCGTPPPRCVQVAYVVQVLREAPPGSSSRDKGRVAEALCRKAADLKAAALVVASQRKGALSEWVLGSVAADCVSHSTRPVLVLHAPLAPLPERPGLLTRLTSVLRGGSKGQHAAEVAAEPTGAASTGEQQQGQERLAQKQQVQQGQQQQRAGSRTILLAVDDSDASEAACVWALRNLHRPGTAFHLLRIIPTLPAG